LVRIVAHLKTELQEVEAQLLALYEKRDGLRQVLGATIESTSNNSHAGPRLCFTNPLSVARCREGMPAAGYVKGPRPANTDCVHNKDAWANAQASLSVSTHHGC